MAKKITINGSNLLQQLTDAWGGTNDTASPQTVHGTTVPAGAEWGMNRGEVERFIKQQLGTKVGDIYWEQDGNYYNVVGFKSTEDRTLYISNPEQYSSLPLFSWQLPISTVTSDSYICQLTGDKSMSNSYVVKNGDTFDVNFRYQSIFVMGATSTSSNYSADGVITIERSVNAGSTWIQVERLTGLTSAEVDDTTFPIAVRLGDYLVADMSNRFRIRASFQFTEDGVTKTRYSSYVTYNISSVNLALEMNSEWSEPVTANASTTNMEVSFRLYGAVQKNLYIKVDDSLFINGNPYDQSYNNATTGAINITDSTKAIFTHGIHKVEAWLTCSNGAGSTLTSDHMVYTLMVVNASTPGADLTVPYILLQELAETVGNFVQSKICKYAVYIPNGGSLPLDLIICSSAQDITEHPSTEYYREEVTAVSGQQYTLNATLEVEDQTSSTNILNAYLQVVREDTNTNFLDETTGSPFEYIQVDNSSGFAPTSGTDIYINPKLRNNGEANPQRILNAVNGSVIGSTWSGFKMGSQDGWITDAETGERMLRVPAGCTLSIAMNPFTQFIDRPRSSLTIAIDMRVSNVINEDDAILQLCEAVGLNFLGLRMRPMVGTITTSSHLVEETSDFRWQEDARTYITINIHSAVAPNSARDGLTADGSVPTGTLSLVRVFINQDIQREFVFSTSTNSEFCTNANNELIIGQSGADIDIFGIRVWERQELSAQEVVQNYISSIPTPSEKLRIKKENDIMEAGVVSLEKVKTLGKNCLIWHGEEVWHDSKSEKLGWWEFYMYDSNGQYIPELSGTICKDTRSLPSKGQGTTAKTYYYWNIQTKYSDAEGMIDVALADLHESITYEVLADEGKVAMKGGCLGKNFPLATESTQKYDLVLVNGNQGVRVPDGWIDGNGKYRGVGHHVATHLPLSQKDVLKINYASSMQSHIVGVNKLYNDLHKAYCGINALQGLTSGAVVAKNLEPFLFFTQADDNSRPVYRGPGTWGAGKMDKPTWGYVKSAFPLFTMIEGSDNNNELTDMRVPFDDVVHGNDTYPKVYYNPEDGYECFMYRTEAGLDKAQKCLDFDGGATDNYGREGEPSLDATHIYVGEYPKPSIVNYIRETWNFLYLHAPRIRPFITSGGTLGTYSEFANSEAANDHMHKYWCSDYKLYRYDFADRGWVSAGLWNGTSYDEVNLRNSSAASGTLERAIYTAWNALTNNQKADYEGAVNKAFISGIAAHAKANIDNYFRVSSLKFHYAFQNHFIAGTDNCSKNTYYVLVPTDGTMGAWTDWRFELHQDDVDTVLATDNSGLQTKPYYIDRMHPYDEHDANETKSLYQGTDNVLFNLCEEMWENTLELSDTLRSILNTMSSLQGGIDTPVSDSMNGVWKTLNKYIFNVQRYIPGMAYNEAARIRYEFPKLMDYSSDQRQVDPIEQSMGSQLESEMQWMKRRLVYMASYAAFGEFAPVPTTNTGLPDVAQSFAMVMAALPNDPAHTSRYTFKLVPHQWLYPTAAISQSGINPHVRVAPNAVNMPNGYYEMVIQPTGASDDGVTIYAANYYRSIGNIGDNCFKPTGTLNLNGKRLTDFIVEPTTYYSTTVGGGSISAAAWQALSEAERENYEPAFRCAGVNIGTATGLTNLSMKGCSNVGGVTIDLTKLTRIETIDLRMTDATGITVPQTTTLTTLQLPDKIAILSLTGQPSLTTLTMEGCAMLRSLTVLNTSLNVQALVERAFSQNAPLTYLNLDNISWTQVSAVMIRNLLTLERNSCLLKGRILMLTDINNVLTFDEVCELIYRYGDFRNQNNDLYISTFTQPISTERLAMSGSKYLNTADLIGNKWYSLGLKVTSANSVAVLMLSDGSTIPDITWQVVGEGNDQYACFDDPHSPVLTILQQAQRIISVRVSVRSFITNEVYYIERNIGLWRRIPEVGDFAWIDGQFDNSMDSSKKLAGIVIRRFDEETDDEGYIIRCKLAIMAPGYAYVPITSDYNTAQMSTVPLAPNTGAKFFPASDEFTQNVFNRVKQSNPSYYNLTTPWDAPVPSYSGGVSASTGNMQDRTTDDGYVHRADLYWNSFNIDELNELLMEWADANIMAALDEMSIPFEHLPRNPKELADLLQLLVNKATENGSSNPARFRLLAYPALRLCNIWCPCDVDNPGFTENDLHPSYKRGKWRLPTTAYIYRIINFYLNSLGIMQNGELVVLRDSGASYTGNRRGSSVYAEIADVDYGNKEGQYPLFSFLKKRGVTITINTSGNHHICVNKREVNYYWGINAGTGLVYNEGTNPYWVIPLTTFEFER